jgi:hypothetical protein
MMAFREGEMDFPTCFLGRNQYTFLVDPVKHPPFFLLFGIPVPIVSLVRAKSPSFFLLIWIGVPYVRKGRANI